MKTATLDKAQWVEILDIDITTGLAFVIDEDGREFEVPVQRLDNIN